MRAEIAAAILDGLTDAEIGERFSLTRREVSELRARAEVSDLVVGHVSAAEVIVRRGAVAAARRLVQLVTDPDAPPAVARAAASDILDRAGVTEAAGTAVRVDAARADATVHAAIAVIRERLGDIAAQEALADLLGRLE
jgi:hypothetical protein